MGYVNAMQTRLITNTMKMLTITMYQQLSDTDLKLLYVFCRFLNFIPFLEYSRKQDVATVMSKYARRFEQLCEGYSISYCLDRILVMTHTINWS